MSIIEIWQLVQGVPYNVFLTLVIIALANEVRLEKAEKRNIQNKYEILLTEIGNLKEKIGHLKGQNEAEERIDNKLDYVINSLINR